MRKFFSFRHNPHLSVYLIYVLITVYLVNHIFNGRFAMVDFEVYYRAARTFCTCLHSFAWVLFSSWRYTWDR
jgi:hypothetical protein